jgi:hypothetical protein
MLLSAEIKMTNLKSSHRNKENSHEDDVSRDVDEVNEVWSMEVRG